MPGSGEITGNETDTCPDLKLLTLEKEEEREPSDLTQGAAWERTGWGNRTSGEAGGKPGQWSGEPQDQGQIWEGGRDGIMTTGTLGKGKH